jgi:hypothetical protein
LAQGKDRMSTWNGRAVIVNKLNDYWDYPPPWGQGSAHNVSGEVPARDLIAELHATILEVTGKPVSAPTRRIGFLP